MFSSDSASTGTRFSGSRRAPAQPPSGHVFRADRKRGPVWYAKYRLLDGRQVQRKLGPAWSERGRPPAGYFTKRLAEDWLRDVLDQVRRGTLPGLVRTGATVADAAAEYMRYIEHERGRKPPRSSRMRRLVMKGSGVRVPASALQKPCKTRGFRVGSAQDVVQLRTKVRDRLLCCAWISVGRSR